MKEQIKYCSSCDKRTHKYYGEEQCIKCFKGDNTFLCQNCNKTMLLCKCNESPGFDGEDEMPTELMFQHLKELIKQDYYSKKYLIDVINIFIVECK